MYPCPCSKHRIMWKKKTTTKKTEQCEKKSGTASVGWGRITTVKDWKADVSIVKLCSSGRIDSDEGLTLETSSFQIIHDGNSTFLKSFDITRDSCWLFIGCNSYKLLSFMSHGAWFCSWFAFLHLSNVFFCFCFSIIKGFFSLFTVTDI